MNFDLQQTLRQVFACNESNEIVEIALISQQVLFETDRKFIEVFEKTDGVTSLENLLYDSN